MCAEWWRKYIEPRSQFKFVYWLCLFVFVLTVFIFDLYFVAVELSKADFTWTSVTVDSSGSLGQYTSIALDSSNNPRISYYYGTGQDLRYTFCDSNCNNAVNWTIATVDTGIYAGQYTSLALDSSNNPRISYYEAYSTLYDLKYAYCNSGCGTAGNWTKVNVDTFGNVGTYTSLALDSSNYPRISYRDVTNSDLKYAYCNSLPCSSGWTTVTVDSTNNVGWDTSLALNSSGNPRISYRYQTGNDLKYAYCDATCNNAGSWTKVFVDQTSDQVASNFTSIAINSSNNPRISYYDYTNGNLKYAYCDSSCGTGGNWSTVIVDSTGDTGQYSSLALDSSSNPRISYYDSSNLDLKFAYCNSNCGTGSSWTIETVDSANYVGSYSSLALDSSNNPQISYQDTTSWYLKYAYGASAGGGDNQPTTYVTVSNETPGASGVTLNAGSAINLTEGTTASITCKGTITDNNGCGDITGVKAKIYRSGASGGSGCTNDNNYCYEQTSCTVDSGNTCEIGGSDLLVDYNCSVNIQYYADPTDSGTYSSENWLCTMWGQDEGGYGSSANSTGVETNTLTALNIDGTISYGALALGANTGASNQQTTGSNTGNNSAIDIELSGVDMTCSTGSIGVGYQEYSNAAFTWGSDGVDLSSSPVSLDIDVQQRTNDNAPQAGVDEKEIYWGLGAPSQGPEGACTGTNTATAVSG